MITILSVCKELPPYSASSLSTSFKFSILALEISSSFAASRSDPSALRKRSACALLHDTICNVSGLAYQFLSHDLVCASERAYSDFVRLEDMWRNEISKGYRPGGRPNVNSLIMYSLVRELKPVTVIETGVASGVSSYFLLKALAENNRGILISIDLPNLSDPKCYVNKDGRRDFVYTPPDRGVGWLVPQRLKSRWKLVFGNSLDLLPQIEVKPDLFYHDSDHSYAVMMKEYDWAYNNGSKFTLSDDISWSRAWMEFVTKNALSHVEVSDMGVAAMRKQTG